MEDDQVVRIANALINIENQLFALNEWLVRYGETRIAPPLASPGIHLAKMREPTQDERSYGQMLASTLRSLEEVQEGKIRPVAELWDGIDGEDGDEAADG